MKWSMLSLAAATVLLLLADALAFHDLFEPHTVRDWLMLVASALVVVGLVGRTAGPFTRSASEADNWPRVCATSIKLGARANSGCKIAALTRGAGGAPRNLVRPHGRAGCVAPGVDVDHRARSGESTGRTGLAFPSERTERDAFRLVRLGRGYPLGRGDMVPGVVGTIDPKVVAIGAFRSVNPRGTQEVSPMPRFRSLAIAVAALSLSACSALAFTALPDAASKGLDRATQASARPCLRPASPAGPPADEAPAVDTEQPADAPPTCRTLRSMNRRLGRRQGRRPDAGYQPRRRRVGRGAGAIMARQPPPTTGRQTQAPGRPREAP